MFSIRKELLFVSICFLIISCSPTETVTETATESEFPEWYVDSGFSSDSLLFSAYATAISSDSLQAISRAEKYARTKLEGFIAKKLETIRYQLEEKGSSHATDADFILTLRNAHAPVEEIAEINELVAHKTENHFKGFAKASVAKDQLRKLLESGFSGKSSFWAELRNSDPFSIEME